MRTPILVTNDGPRAASPEEIIEQGVRVYVENALREITKGGPMDGRTPPVEYVDLLAHVVACEVKAAMLSGFDKAVNVSSFLKEANIVNRPMEG